MIGFLDAWLGPPSAGWVNKGPADDYWYTPRGRSTTSGVQMTEQVALTYATVYACVAKRARTIAALPAGVMERVSEEERRPAPEHPLNRILQVEANPDSGAISWREKMLVDLQLWGNFYAEEIRNNGGELVGLNPLQPGYMTPMRNPQGELFFHYTESGNANDFAARDILHVPALSLNGITGMSVVGYHAETIGLGIAASTFASAFYDNGAWMGGWIREPPGTPGLSPERQREVLAQLNERFRGAAKAFGLGYLAEGREYVAMQGMPLKDAQFLEGRQFTRTDICAIFDVPPSKIHDDTRSTFSNVEQKNLDWMTDGVLPWCVRIEQFLKRRYDPDGRYYVKHNLSALVRGDLKTRYDSYAIGRNWGWLTTNDVRRMEDMNPVAGGDDRLIPVNMYRIIDGEIAQIQQPQQPTEGQKRIGTDGAAAKVIEPASFAGLFLDAAQRIVAKECSAIEKAYKRRAKEATADGFREWAATFYREQEAFAKDALTAPVATALTLLNASGCAAKVAGLAAAYAAESLADVLSAANDADPMAVPLLVTKWRKSKAAALADRIRSVASILN